MPHKTVFSMKNQKHEQGTALVTTLFVVVVAAAIIGAALNFTQGTNKQTDSSRMFSNLRFEGEGAIEAAYGIWLKAGNNKYGPPNSDDLDVTVRGPSPTGSTSPFNYPYAAGGALRIDMLNEYGAPLPAGTAVTPTSIPISLTDYPGWKGTKFSYGISVKLASSAAGNAKIYGLKRTLDYISVPLFQAMGFFEGDIEIYKPAPMLVGGLVHTNGKAFFSSTSATGLTFQNNVSNVNGYSPTDVPIGAAAWSAPGTMYPPVFSNGGEADQMSTVDRLEPLGTSPAASLNTTDTNPNNDSMREIIEPPTTGYTDPPAIAKQRLYNKAGIVIKITGPISTAANVTVTTKNGVSLTAAQVTSIKSALSAQTITDRRENKSVGVTTVDVGALTATLNAATGYVTNGVVYVYDTSSTGVSDPKAIRLKNGGTLPNAGLTVASVNPIYIQGDYNTGSNTSTYASVPSNAALNSSNNLNPVQSGYTTKPSAVIGDAITILSNGWNDANSSSTISSRPAANTTVNTAIVTGNIPSGWDDNGTVAPYGYSGGFNNFPRFLETWSGKGFTYFGSMVQLFSSQTFTGRWDTGAIYSPPTRAWNFDTALLTNPPPGSLSVVTRSRGKLTRY